MYSIKFHFPIPITIAIKILQLIAITINCVPSLHWQGDHPPQHNNKRVRLFAGEGHLAPGLDGQVTWMDEPSRYMMDEPAGCGDEPIGRLEPIDENQSVSSAGLFHGICDSNKGERHPHRTGCPYPVQPSLTPPYQTDPPLTNVICILYLPISSVFSSVLQFSNQFFLQV